MSTLEKRSNDGSASILFCVKGEKTGKKTWNSFFFYPISLLGCLPHRPVHAAGPGRDRKGVAELHEAQDPPPGAAVGDGRQSPGRQAGAAMEGPEEGERRAEVKMEA